MYTPFNGWTGDPSLEMRRRLCESTDTSTGQFWILLLILRTRCRNPYSTVISMILHIRDTAHSMPQPLLNSHLNHSTYIRDTAHSMPQSLLNSHLNHSTDTGHCSLDVATPTQQSSLSLYTYMTTHWTMETRKFKGLNVPNNTRDKGNRGTQWEKPT